MAQMNAAIFDRREDAQRAVHALRDHGVAEEEISVMALADDGSGKVSDMDHGERVPAPGKDEGISTTTPEDAAKGAAEGAAIGAGLGLLAGLSSIFIPGFGLITAGGALAWALGGAAAATAGGAVAGGVTGYLADMGVPSERAQEYEDAIKQGGILVSVHDTDEATHDEIEQIFSKYNGRHSGAYNWLAESGEGLPTPQSLDSTNNRLRAEDQINTGGDLSRTEISPSAGNVIGITRDTERTESHLDAVTGDEGSASSRLGDVRVGPNPDDYGSSTTNRETTTDAVIDTGNVGSTTSGLGEMDADEVNVRTEPPESPSANVTGTLGGNVGGVGGSGGNLTGSLGSSMGDQPGIGGGTVASSSGALGGTTGILASEDVKERDNTLMNTTEDMTGRNRTGDTDRLTAAEIAGTAGGASAGANTASIGDYSSAVRPDEDADLDNVSPPIAVPEGNTSGPTSGSTVGGTTNTGGRAGITTSGGADTSPTLDVDTGGATTSRTLDEDEDDLR